MALRRGAVRNDDRFVCQACIFFSVMEWRESIESTRLEACRYNDVRTLMARGLHVERLHGTSIMTSDPWVPEHWFPGCFCAKLHFRRGSGHVKTENNGHMGQSGGYTLEPWLEAVKKQIHSGGCDRLKG